MLSRFQGVLLLIAATFVLDALWVAAYVVAWDGGQLANLHAIAKACAGGRDGLEEVGGTSAASRAKRSRTANPYSEDVEELQLARRLLNIF